MSQSAACRRAAASSYTPDHEFSKYEMDNELMIRAREGDKAAFQELFTRHSRPLVNFVCRFVGSRDRAEELAQDAFLQIYKARARYEPKARFSTYLYRVATNLCLNDLRRLDYQGKFQSLDGESTDHGHELHSTLKDDAAGVEERVAARELGVRIQASLDELPPNQKLALLLSRVDGFSYREVAECLSTSESAVKSLVFRATMTLRETLGDLLGKPSG
jgi:RNA polymerase sigma-70 factor (ECF subfamily)